LFALALLAAAPSAAAVRNPDTLVIAQVGEPASLDPAFPYEGVSQSLIYNLYETLIAFDGPALDRFVPVLATEVPSLKNGGVSKDGLTYTFKLRHGVRFHNGDPMTADDVAYSLRRFMLMDASGGPSSLLLEPILGVASTRDDKGGLAVEFADAERAVSAKGDAVVIRLKRPFAPFLSIMARWSYVLDRNWTAGLGDWDGSSSTWKAHNNPPREGAPLLDKANGTAPFKLERWDRPGKIVLLARNDSYWRKPAAIKRVIIKVVPELATRKLMLQAGDADFVDVPRPYLPQVQGMEGVRIVDGLQRLSTDPVLFFTFNVNPSANPDIGSGELDGDGVPPDFFSDLDVRKGFAYAFDYDAFIRDSYKGRARRAKGAIPPGLPGFYPGQPAHTLNRDKAIAYLKKAWGGQVWDKGFTFTLTYNTGGEIRELACAILKKGVESLNPKFKINVRGVDWPSFMDKTQARKMPLFSRGWIADYPDSHNFVFPFYHSQGRYPIAQAYNDPQMDQWIEAALREVDPKKREALYFKIQERAFDTVPQLYTVHADGVVVMRDWVHGFVDNPIFMGLWLYPLSKS